MLRISIIYAGKQPFHPKDFSPTISRARARVRMRLPISPFETVTETE